MKSRNISLLFAIGGLFFVSSCGSPSNHQEEMPTELTPVDEVDRTRYNINEDTEAMIGLDSVQTDSTHRDH